MPRHAEPDNVRWWKHGPPACCHTCEYYNEEGLCEKHQEAPPEEFAAQDGACRDWVMDLPF